MRTMSVKTGLFDRSQGYKLTESFRKCLIFLVAAILILSTTLCFIKISLAATTPSPGDYIVTEFWTSKLSMITPSGVRTEIYNFKTGTHDMYPSSVAIDSSGNYIVTASYDGNYGRLYRVTPSGSSTLVYAWAGYLEGPAGVAVDGSGNYIVTESGLMVQVLSKITPSGVRTVIYDYKAHLPGAHYPGALAIDSSGNYIVTESNVGALRENDTLSRITPSGVRTVLYTFPHIAEYANFIAIDGSGNYIITDDVNDALYKITPSGTKTVIYDFGGGAQVQGVAVDSSGNYIVAEQYAQKLSKITPGGVRTVIYTYTGVGEAPWGVAIVPGAPAGYSVTIWGWDYIYGWQVPVPITMDGVSTGYSTPHTFTDLTGTHNFTVPSTNSKGHPFSDWDVGGGNIRTDETITVNSAGVYTARYRAGYSVTIWGWDYIYGWQVPVPITMDGVSTGYSTPHTFTDLTGTHNFTVPSINSKGHPFSDWSTGSTSRTLTVNSAGVYTARYRACPWDITGPTMWVPDGKCDMRDVALVAKLYGSIEGDGKYDARADITGPTYLVADGKIDMRDVALVAKHYGEIY